MLQRISRLNLSQRFAVLGVLTVGLLAVVAALLVHNLWAQRDGARRAVAGTPAALSLQSLASELQRHRLYSGRLLGNDAGATAAQQHSRQQVEHLLQRLGQDLAALPEAASLQSALQEVRQRYETLVADVQQQKMTVRESFDRHGELLRMLDDLSAQVLLVSGLLLDADAARHLFIVAGFQEGKTVMDQLAQLHELGTMVLANKGASPLDLHQLAAIHARLEDRDRFFAQTLMLARQHGARLLTPALEQALQQAAAGIRQALEQVQLTFLGISPDWSVLPADYGKPLEQAMQAQQALTRGIAEGVVAELQARERALAWSLVAVLAVLVLLLAGLGVALWALVRSIVRPLQATSEQARRMAAGDLSVALALQVQHEVGQTLGALERMRQHWATVLADMQAAAGGVTVASQELRQGHDELARRAERAAQELQQTARFIDALLGEVGQAVAAAQQARELADDAARVADSGGVAMQEVMATMESIQRHSGRIEDITGVIDGLAFQTNILALNAAVEAARAGEHGRGFAVVAAEVRSLAQRSATAAREIKALIQNSTQEVGQGTVRIRAAGRTMDDIVAKVRQVHERIQQLTRFADAQQAAVSTLAQSVGEMDQLTQQNAALAEQSTAVIHSLAQQAARLQQTAQHFRLPAAQAVTALPVAVAVAVADTPALAVA